MRGLDEMSKQKTKVGDKVVCLVNKGEFVGSAVYIVTYVGNFKGAIMVSGINGMLYEGEYVVVRRIEESVK